MALGERTLEVDPGELFAVWLESGEKS